MPLRDVRVVEIAKYLPVPLAGQTLADLGAEVIKLEPPGIGDPTRVTPPAAWGTGAYFHAVNRSKRSFAVDLKRPEGVQAAHRLLLGADVLLDGNRPGVLARLGLDPEVLRRENPRLVYCALTGYGLQGARAQEPGHDINYQALAGVLSLTGTAERPVAPGTQTADVAGALWTVVGVLAALLRRQATGQGQTVDTALVEACLPLLTLAAAGGRASGSSPAREADLLTGMLPAYRLYRCADGAWVSLGALEPKFWAEFCRAAGRPDLESRFVDPSVASELEALFASRTRAAWDGLLGERACCYAPVRTPLEALDDPELRARGAAVPVPAPDGSAPVLPGTPLGLSESPVRPPRRPPELGADTRAILLDLGYAPQDVEALRATGVIQS